MTVNLFKELNIRANYINHHILDDYGSFDNQTLFLRILNYIKSEINKTTNRSDIMCAEFYNLCNLDLKSCNIVHLEKGMRILLYTVLHHLFVINNKNDRSYIMTHYICDYLARRYTRMHHMNRLYRLIG